MSRLAQAIVSTVLVVGGPALGVLALHASGAVASPLLLVAIGVALSVAVSNAAAAWWKRRRAPGDLLFGELMIWGWLRRRRFERLLAHAERLLGARADRGESPQRLDPGQRARLLERLSRRLEASDPYTHGHSRRVARHSAAIARRMGLPREEIARIRSAAAIHDVGKIEVPAEILRKPAALSDEEYEVVKEHAATGARMAAPLGDAELTRIVHHHHERLNGKGYPDGLAGEAIPLGARIIAVADTFDALTSERPYRAAMSHREAFALLGS
ncbi:MAG: HD-GYP domain-containing protein, partial [Solirubrobacterales bacterium]